MQDECIRNRKNIGQSHSTHVGDVSPGEDVHEYCIQTYENKDSKNSIPCADQDKFDFYSMLNKQRMSQSDRSSRLKPISSLTT